MVKCVVFDLDGVIFDVSARLRAVLEELRVKSMDEVKRNPKLRNKFWKLFLSQKYMYLDAARINVIEYMRNLKKKGYKIVIITGRVLEKQGEETKRQLDENKVPYDEIYFRRKNDRRKDVEYKKAIIQWLIYNGCDIVEIHEDSREIINSLKELIPNARFYIY